MRSVCEFNVRGIVETSACAAGHFDGGNVAGRAEDGEYGVEEMDAGAGGKFGFVPAMADDAGEDVAGFAGFGVLREPTRGGHERG